MRIAIIGGGAAAVSLLHQLINRFSDLTTTERFAHDKIEICIIEKEREAGPGLAYSTSDHAHILNLPAKVMSPIPEDPNHFFKWALENKAIWQKDFPDVNIETCDFPPRALYGTYLKHLLTTLIENAHAKNITVRILTSHEAVNLKREAHSNGLRVIFANESEAPLLCDQVVLSVGHLASDNYCEFKENNHYVHSPWPVENLQRIPKESAVFIAGTRLTAIDTVLSLKANGHTGKIILGSRLGLLPCVIGNVDSSYNRRFLTLENIIALSDYGTKKLGLDQVIALFVKEMNANPLSSQDSFNLDSAMNPTASATEFLKREIDEVQSGSSRHWQNVLFSLYSNISVLWDTLSESAKELFLSKYYSVWMTYLAAFPIENALKMFELLEQREIEIRGGLEKTAYDSEQGKFHIFFQDEPTPVKCDFFINATGASHNVEKTPSQLLQNLVKNKVLVPYHLGGVKVEFKTLQPVSDKCVDGLYVMGDSGTYGACMATADLGQSGKQACRIANTMFERLKTPNLQSNPSISKRYSFESSPLFGSAKRSFSMGNLPDARNRSPSAPTPSLTTPTPYGK